MALSIQDLLFLSKNKADFGSGPALGVRLVGLRVIQSSLFWNDGFLDETVDPNLLGKM